MYIIVDTDVKIYNSNQAYRDYSLSLHHGPKLRAPETLRTSQHYGIEEFKWGPSIMPP